MYLAHRSTLAMLAAWTISSQVAADPTFFFTSLKRPFRILQASIAAWNLNIEQCDFYVLFCPYVFINLDIAAVADATIMS